MLKPPKMGPFSDALDSTIEEEEGMEDFEERAAETAEGREDKKVEKMFK